MDLEAEYNNRARVPEHPAHIAGWQRDAAAWRQACPRSEFDLAYGPAARERLDLFHAGPEDGAPLALFIHGGYWQALDRSFASHCARGMNGRGIAVAVPSYELCPGVTLTAIVAQMRAACAFLWRRTGRRILATGHSAGGHLAAMLLATDWPTYDAALPDGLVHAALPISGVFELEPLLATSIGAGLRLTQHEARALSPRWMPSPCRPLHCVVGGAESSEFIRQSRDMAEAWGGGFNALPGADHFTVIAPLADPASSLVEIAARLARG
ncbi:alpha/beta hydrolase [Falsiroseomonas bella]|uniref:Alpha/beta hydrolase n=1 Tax=Falsiroseomonas bella TaxID=2184016 RepID=A0A317F783_9PROT|nr:alpha/beta hydrolase [Falsiroseomonas bella]PWS34595.1 alpha/beta hydrolase [Falsiroseomonas bella]